MPVYSPGTIKARMAQATIENPDYVTLGDAARILKRSRSTVWEFHNDLESITVYGVKLYKRDALVAYMRAKSTAAGSVIRVTGIEVERLRRICEVYYRQNYDIAEPAMKRLAKRIARL